MVKTFGSQIFDVSADFSFLFYHKAISWTLYNLALYPEWQRKCQDEVKEVYGDKNELEWLDTQLHMNHSRFQYDCLMYA